MLSRLYQCNPLVSLLLDVLASQDTEPASRSLYLYLNGHHFYGDFQKSQKNKNRPRLRVRTVEISLACASDLVSCIGVKVREAQLIAYHMTAKRNCLSHDPRRPRS